MLSVAKLATTFVAATVVVPASVPPPGFAPSATVTLPVKPATALPSASCAVTCTAGAIAWPAVVVPGCPVNASCVAGPGVMLNAALAVPVRPAAVVARGGGGRGALVAPGGAVGSGAAVFRVYPVPPFLLLSPAKLATPLPAGPVVVPVSVPPLGFVPRATATEPANPVATLPPASSAVTCTAGVIAVPAAVFVGCTLKTNWVAAPTVPLKEPLVAPVSPVAAAASV